MICDHPFHENASVDNNSRSIIIKGYTEPALEGTSLSFECYHSDILIGPNSTTCMGNGEWEPDPKKVACRGIIIV